MKLWPRVWCLVFLTHGVYSSNFKILVAITGFWYSIYESLQCLQIKLASFDKTGYQLSNGIRFAADDAIEKLVCEKRNVFLKIYMSYTPGYDLLTTAVRPM